MTGLETNDRSSLRGTGLGIYIVQNVYYTYIHYIKNLSANWGSKLQTVER